jgi:hypothetical protein
MLQMKPIAIVLAPVAAVAVIAAVILIVRQELLRRPTKHADEPGKVELSHGVSVMSSTSTAIVHGFKMVVPQHFGRRPERMLIQVSDDVSCSAMAD